MAKATRAPAETPPLMLELSGYEAKVLSRFIWSGGKWPKGTTNDGIALNGIHSAIAGILGVEVDNG